MPGRLLYAGVLTALTLACSPTPDALPAPADLLPPKQLVSLLADLHVAENRAQRSARAADTVQAMYLRAEADIYRQRHLTRAQFDQSYAYYATRPAELEEIYAALIDTLAMREVRVKVK